MAGRKRKSRAREVTRFKVGDRVRVRRGVADVEYPDLPLGGWAGTVAEIHDDGMYTPALQKISKFLGPVEWRSGSVRDAL